MTRPIVVIVFMMGLLHCSRDGRKNLRQFLDCAVYFLYGVQRVLSYGLDAGDLLTDLAGSGPGSAVAARAPADAPNSGTHHQN